MYVARVFLEESTNNPTKKTKKEEERRKTKMTGLCVQNNEIYVDFIHWWTAKKGKKNDREHSYSLIAKEKAETYVQSV